MTCVHFVCEVVCSATQSTHGASRGIAARASAALIRYPKRDINPDSVMLMFVTASVTWHVFTDVLAGGGPVVGQRLLLLGRISSIVLTVDRFSV